jgi:hypothetical protein
MVQFEIEADVPESRQVTVTLPPEAQPGRVKLRITIEPESAPPALPRLKGVLPDQEVTVVRSGLFRVVESERSE